jgi:hypothetical protein
MSRLSILFTVFLATTLATSAGAIQIDSLLREVWYSGGLEQPDMMGDSASSAATGTFDTAFSDGLSDPGVAASGVDVSQYSLVDIDSGGLVVDVSSFVDNYADNYASTVVAGAIADSIAWSELDVTFTTTEIMWLSVDVFVSSSLGVFYDGPGAGLVETSHVASFLLCKVGDGCAADLFVEDVTDNGMAVSSGVQDAGLLLPGQYSIELLVVSQSISRDVGSAAGSADFSGSIRVDPLPEPGAFAGVAAGVALLAVLGQRRGVTITSC